MLPEKYSNFSFKILKFIVKDSIRDGALEDFIDKYELLYKDCGKITAILWLWFQIIYMLPSYFLNSILWGFIMFKNYLKIGLRSLKKQKGYSFINISGLSIGLFTFILILLYVNDELKYDKFHKNGKNIYRLVRDLHYSEKMGAYATTSAPYATELLVSFPNIISQTVRFYNPSTLVSYKKENIFQESRFHYVDPNVFDVFSFNLKYTHQVSPLLEPFTIVLSENMAVKYFGNEDPVGKVLKIDNKYDFRVTGILEKLPENSHIKIDFLASFNSLKTIFGFDPSKKTYSTVWRPLMYTYLFIPDVSRIEELKIGFPDFIVHMYGEWARSEVGLKLQPLLDIHLRSNLKNEIEPNGDIRYIYVISAVGVFVLIIACINFMNLSTCQIARRANEVGIRKTFGAGRFQLIIQYLTESVGYSIFSLIIALSGIAVLLPYFNKFMNKEIMIDKIWNLQSVSGIFILIIFIGFVSGSYPAFYLSSFNPVKVFKRIGYIKSRRLGLRKILIIMQFVISITILIITLVIREQMIFIKSKKLGLNKNQVIAIPLRDSSMFEKYRVYKTKFSASPFIKNVSFTSELPFKDALVDYVYRIAATPENEYPNMYMLSVEYDFVKTMEMKIIKGRDFNENLSSDFAYGYILNEAAVKKLGFENPVGKLFGRDHITHYYKSINRYGTVIGVIEDFHFRSLHNNIDPIAMFIHPSKRKPYRYIVVRIGSGDIKEAVEFLEETWKKLEKGRPFETLFLDSLFEQLYRLEKKLGIIFKYFTFLTLFVVCLGLFGLISYTTEQRNKEIAIRKIFGSSVSRIFIIVVKEFVWLFLIGNIIAYPISYFVMKKWLENFAYHINLNITIFILSGILAFLITFFTVSYQSYKAAEANPVDSLRNE